MAQSLLEVTDISKSYSGVKALDAVSLAINTGEIHCLIGENGSGKSTLIKIIGGAVAPDSGRVLIKGRGYPHLHAIDAIREGIQIIYQDLSLYPNLTVAENISLNQLVEQGQRIINRGSVRTIARNALDQIQVDLDLEEKVENLSVAKKQLVAISRALTQDASLIIMDEPTSALTKNEIDHLFSVINRLKARNISTLFVSHKLSEVFQISETVTILKDGKKIGDYRTGDLDAEKLAFIMTGIQIDRSKFCYEAAPPAPHPLLEVRSLSRRGHFQDISFSLHPGEILGILGRLGSGRTELALSLFGMNRIDTGEILLEGKRVRPSSPQQAIALGISYLPEDRLTQGLFLGQSISVNIIVTVLKKLRNLLGLISRDKRNRMVEEEVRSLKIKTDNPENPVTSLSGGNQQRVVLAKWLGTNPRVFILDGPTIGVDIASKANIHLLVRECACRGMGVIVISDEIPEALQNCNRIMIMRRGKNVGIIDNTGKLTEEEISALCTSEEE
jgi:simple sugar transport system ATP-binding protein